MTPDVEVAPPIPETVTISFGGDVKTFDIIDLAMAVSRYFSHETPDDQALEEVKEDLGLPNLTAFQLAQVANGLEKKFGIENIKKNVQAAVMLIQDSEQKRTQGTSPSSDLSSPSGGTSEESTTP